MLTAEIELIESQEDLTYKCHIPLSSGNRLQSVNIQNLKRPEYNFFTFLAHYIAVHHVESLFSVIKFVKSKYHVSLTNEHLKELIYTAFISYHPDFRNLANNVDTHSRSNAGKISKKL